MKNLKVILLALSFLTLALTSCTKLPESSTELLGDSNVIYYLVCYDKGKVVSIAPFKLEGDVKILTNAEIGCEIKLVRLKN